MSAWSRRGFLAGAGMLATAGGGRATTSPGTDAAVPLLRTYVAGVNRQAVREAAPHLRAGAPLRLIREPENDYDGRAVSVWAQDGRKLGYVPRIDNQALANLMDAGHLPRAAVEGVRSGATRPEIRVLVTVSMPRMT